MDVATKGRLEATLAVLAILVTLHFAPDARAQPEIEPADPRMVEKTFTFECWPLAYFDSVMYQGWRLEERASGPTTHPALPGGKTYVGGSTTPKARLWFNDRGAWAWSYRDTDGYECIIDTGPILRFKTAPPDSSQPVNEETP